MAAQRKRVSTENREGTFKALLHKIGGRGPWWAVTLRWLTFLGVTGFVVGAASFFVLYRMIEIPDANADFETQTTKIYYSDNKHKIGSFAKQDREIVTIDKIPASMQAAAIAAEDRSFYTNRGLDFKGIIRAARNNATSGEIQGGGSTITQQYVKILYLTQERSYKRKVKEAILSIKIHNQQSKKEILEGYLNTIYFGNGAYGVEVAAQTYFRKPASKLTVPQSAALATIINNPSFYDPYIEGATERILSRYTYVIDGMEKSGAIDSAEAAKYRDTLPKFEKRRDINRFSGSKGYLLSLVKKQLQNLEFTDSQIEGGGLRVVTTFSYAKQMDAIAAVKSVRPNELKELHTALVSVQPGTGAVRAMYGGRDYLKSQLNWATLGTQPGSTFKAFAVIAALEDGYSLKTTLNGNSPLKFGSEVEIENQGDSGGASFGKVPLLKATEKSINTAFVDLVDQMGDGTERGAKKVLAAAQDAGIPESVVSKIQPVLSTPLGFAPVAPVDMANAYATIAASGKRADWFVIEKVTGAGVAPYKHKVVTEQAIPKDVAADTIAALQGVVRSGTGTKGRTVCPTAGKTGTATAGKAGDSRVSSSWFTGFTPKLATAVMYNRGKGNGQLEGYLNPFFGGTFPALTFQAYMNAAVDPDKCGSFPPPANIKSTKGTIFKPPPPTCGSDEELNGSKTACVAKPKPKPTQEPCGPTEQPDGNLGCEPKPKPTPTPEPKCDDNPLTPKPPCATDPPPEPAPGGGWILLPLLAGASGLGQRRVDEAGDGSTDEPATT